MRSGNPLTVFVTTNRSRSQWNPSRGPGIGQDRPSYAPGYNADNAVLGRPDAVVRPERLRPAAGRHVRRHRPRRLHRPEPADAEHGAQQGAASSARARRLEFRVEAFNLLNRANFGVPELRAFAGTRDDEPALATFGRITTTVTSARQVQLGVRVSF